MLTSYSTAFRIRPIHHNMISSSKHSCDIGGWEGGLFPAGEDCQGGASWKCKLSKQMVSVACQARIYLNALDGYSESRLDTSHTWDTACQGEGFCNSGFPSLSCGTRPARSSSGRCASISP